MRNASVTELSGLLKTRDDLVMDGWSRSEIDRAIAQRRMRRLRRGCYIGADAWSDLWPESRHLAHVVAADEDATGGRPVFALISAAVLLGLPLHRAPVDRVHTLTARASRRSIPGVVRHVGSVADGDIVEVHGMLCTSLERTIYDLARLARPETSLPCADAALGRLGGDPRQFDSAAADSWAAELQERVARGPGMRGIRHARMILELADGRSQLPLESVTKLQLHRLGFRRLGLQVSVQRRFWMDIELEGAGAFYECDGEGKYLDEALRSGRDLERVLLDEKQREDWVRGATGKRVLRGGSIHSASPAALAERLSSFGVALPSHRDRLILPSRPFVAGL